MGVMDSSSGLPSYVKPAIIDFKGRELEFMDHLPRDVKRKLGNLKDFDTEKNHMRHYGDFAFTLAGVKPCALFAHGVGPFYAKGLAEAALLPVMKEYKLEDYGFKAREIKHKLLTSNPAHPGFTGGWVLLNTRHEGYALAKKTFVDPSPRPVDELQIGLALGYPLPSDWGTIRYIDATECERLNTCCVPVLEYFCPPGADTIVPIVNHFKAYRNFWTQLGRNLTIDTVGHPAFSSANSRWPGQAS